ncbi:FAD-dependent oxidoreductase [Streptomyces sp. NRRL B-1568]|nr:FAD-dependent oxidoreductase [Streptomyces sp. NRRL B-1568]
MVGVSATTPAQTVDVAVVGAGIIGVMTAREILRRDPGARVAVLDQDAVGSGASRRSAGLHFPRGATERVRRMSEYSQDHYAKLTAERPGLPIHTLGMTLVADDAGEAQLRRTYLPGARLSRVGSVPGGFVRVPAECGVWEGEGCQYADVHALTGLLARELRGRAAFHEGVQVTAVESGEDTVALRLGTGRTLLARQALLAPGPWLAAPAWKDLVAPLGARVKKVVALHIEQQPREDDHAIVFHDEDAFLLPLHERGHWLFSYTCQEWDVDPDTLGGGLSDAHLRDALALLERYAPELAGLCTSGRVFCDAYGPDGEPVVSRLPQAGRVVFAGAANGSGYRLAPAIAAEAADLLCPVTRQEPGQEEDQT